MTQRAVREPWCSASDCQVSNFESRVWRAVSSHSFHHPQEVLLAKFSLHKGGLKPHSYHLFTLGTFEGTRSKGQMELGWDFSCDLDVSLLGSCLSLVPFAFDPFSCLWILCCVALCCVCPWCHLGWIRCHICRYKCLTNGCPFSGYFGASIMWINLFNVQLISLYITFSTSLQYRQQKEA